MRPFSLYGSHSCGHVSIPIHACFITPFFAFFHVLTLSRLSLAAVKRGKGSGELVTAFIGGLMGAGKTTYAIHVAYEVYKALGYEDPWKAAVDHLFLTPAAFSAWLDRALENYRRHVEEERIHEYRKTPIIVIDDLAGGWIDRYGWRDATVQSFVKLFNMLRSLTSTVLITSIEREDVVKSIRNKMSFLIHVAPIRGDLSRATGYRRLIDHKGSEKLELAFHDYFRRGGLPKEVYLLLERSRLNALKELCENLIESPVPRSRDPIDILREKLEGLGVEVNGDLRSSLRTAVEQGLLPHAFITAYRREVAITRATLDALGLETVSLPMLAELLGGRVGYARAPNGKPVAVVLL
ncbi:MAG: hypothetical protein QXU64_04740 [Thermofilaceae archaeon]